MWNVSIALKSFLETNCFLNKNYECINKVTNRKIKACVPVHIFGHPCKIDEIVEICNKWNISVIEDAAESIGSYYKDKHTGIFGKCAILSFNGNETAITGGGMIITDDEELAKLQDIFLQLQKSHILMNFITMKLVII